MNLLTNLDLGDYLSLLVALLVLLNLLRPRTGTPMSPEWRTFWIEFVKNNTGIAWSFTASLVFMWALFHATHDRLDAPVIETFKTLLAGAVGWMGGMLTGRAGQAIAQPPLVAGTEGTRDTITTLHEKAPLAPPLDPSAPLVIQKVIDPVVTKPEDGK